MTDHDLHCTICKSSSMQNFHSDWPSKLIFLLEIMGQVRPGMSFSTPSSSKMVVSTLDVLLLTASPHALFFRHAGALSLHDYSSWRSNSSGWADRHRMLRLVQSLHGLRGGRQFCHQMSCCSVRSDLMTRVKARTRLMRWLHSELL